MANTSLFSRSDIIPVVVPRNNSRLELSVESRKEGIVGRTMPPSFQSRASDIRKFSNAKDELERSVASAPSEIAAPMAKEMTELADRVILPLGKSFFVGFCFLWRNYDPRKCKKRKK